MLAVLISKNGDISVVSDDINDEGNKVKVISYDTREVDESAHPEDYELAYVPHEGGGKDDIALCYKEAIGHVGPDFLNGIRHLSAKEARKEWSIPV